MIAVSSPQGTSSVSARRKRTRDQVLETLTRAGGGLTRAELGARTGLSASAVSDCVHSLRADGLVVEHVGDAAAGSRRGRRPTVISLAGNDGVVVGIDLGHEHVTAAVATMAGAILSQCTETLDVDRQPVQALDAAAALTFQAVRHAGASMSDVLGIAAGVPGPIGIRPRLVTSPTILSAWAGIAPADELADRLGQTVVVGNDADLGARGEHAYGAARGIDDFVYVKASHGIGAGIVLDGRTYHGSTGIAGEIGHTQIPEATNWCRCGSRGCLETVVSITAVRQQLVHVLTSGQPPADGDTVLPRLADLAENPAVTRVLTDSGRIMGRVLADLVNCLNPAALVLGGELGAWGEPFAEGVRESVARYAQPASAQAARVLTAQLGPDAELRGAIATAVATAQPADSHHRPLER